MDNTEETKPKPKKRASMKTRGGKRKVNVKWILTITIAAFVLSVLMSAVSSTALSQVDLVPAVVILLIIIAIGVLFDIIGVAMQAAEEKPFHSMAAKKVHGASEAIGLIRNAEKMSSICNDVIGDIAGILSGSTVAAVLVFFVAAFQQVGQPILSLLLTGTVSALTIGGKALGKTFAMNNANTIVYVVGIVWHYIKKINIFSK